MAAVKLVGFLFLLAVIFVCAHAIGGRVGPVTTGRSSVQQTGPGGGMNMGSAP